jgi:hypothetical protein
MYRGECPITPTQVAINGALSDYVEGRRREDLRKMLFGLSVLRHATEGQIRIAMPQAKNSQGTTSAGIQNMRRR